MYGLCPSISPLKLQAAIVNILFATGGLEVYKGCSGIKSIIDLLGLAGLLLVMVPSDWMKRILLPVVAVLIGFLVNGVRVVLMGILVASSNLTAFEYWHVGDGSLIFSTISVLLFGLFCFGMFRINIKETENLDAV